VDLCLARGLYAEFYVGEQFVVSDWREAMRPAWASISGDPDGLVEELDLDATELIKATIVAFAPDELAAIVDAVRSLGLVPGEAPSPLMPDASFVNVNSPEADKGKGLAFAARHLSIGFDEVVAVGDGANDVAMLAVAGTAVAMGQAAPAVHEAAHVIVPEVEADGVAHALRAAAHWRGQALGRAQPGGR
jgi:hydroxymethylpyrimidine pyrophosphatase-like HAD family hydrolase